MSSRGQFNTKSPTIKRILKEASELATSPSTDYHAEPLESNLFEWHFTLRGPPSPSPYEGGIYHGRIVLPTTYPLRPPSFRFLTPSGRFEVNREICLSISGHHEESWQPAWGIRTALVAIRSFMDTAAKGQLGGLECAEPVRKRLARESLAWKCSSCGKSNADIIKARETEVALIEPGDKIVEEIVPEELRLTYREDLDEQKVAGSSKATASPTFSTIARNAPSIGTQTEIPPSTRTQTLNPPTTTPTPTRTAPPAQQLQQPRNLVAGHVAIVDKAIYGVLFALAIMILRKMI